MTARALTLHACEYMIWRACRRLPPDTGTDRFREWTAELPFILDDEEVEACAARLALALWFAADQCRGVHHLPGRARYSWADATQDALLATRVIANALLVPVTAVLYGSLTGMAFSLLGGIGCVIGVLAGVLNGPGTEGILIVTTLIGGTAGGIAGGIVAVRQVAQKIRDRWQKWYVIRMAEVADDAGS